MKPLFIGLFISSVLCAQSELAGFRPQDAQEELALEKRFDAFLHRENLQNWLKTLSSRPHHLGSPYGKEVANWIAQQFRAWGYDTHIERFDVLFPTPKTRLLEMTGPAEYHARLTEPALPEDATSDKTAEGLPVYHAFSTDGDVTGQLVYVNYGLPPDYEALEERGIDVKGKIVIARYGASWRGIKPKVAAEHGAIGCIIYSDPRDDGYFQGDPYPKGGWRNEWSAQRGSVLDMPTYPGDPLTPGVGATADAKRLPRSEAATITRIPVLPIAWGDALPLLRALGGPVAPDPWRGALPITYHMGPGPATVHLKLEFDWKLTPAYDVIARLAGRELPEEWVIRGNHHDAWVFGASDPLSGLVPMLEEARAVGELARSGWRPRRTLIYAAWDGEEPALLGSTEWAEAHAEELQKHAAVYVNSDSNGRGFLWGGGSQELRVFYSQIGEAVSDPEKGVTALERARAERIFKSKEDERKEIRADNALLNLTPLGSGSDYTPFLQHLGIASLNIGFSGEGVSSGSYHSNYDSYDHFIRFEDPDLQYSLVFSKVSGRTSLRLANADVLPFHFANFVRAIDEYIKDIEKNAKKQREEAQERNRLLEEKAYELASDPTKPQHAPARREEPPALHLDALRTSLDRLKDTAAKVDALESKAPDWPLEKRRAWDQILMHSEQTLLRKEGLPRRPWYRHMIYAPGYYTGYGVKTLPGVREAVEERNWSELRDQIPQAAAALDRLDATLRKAAGQ